MYLLLKLSLISTLLFACSQKENASQTTTIWPINSKKPPLELIISIPQNSGLAFVDYKKYTVRNDSLLVVKRSFYMSMKDTTNNYKSDTIATYKLDPYRKAELREILNETDSLGHHSARGCLMQMGRYRFFISTHMDGKDMDGFIANCYREHIFKLVDFLNDCYPKGDVIPYSKEDLIEIEKNCVESN